jgi:hypothetical protein
MLVTNPRGKSEPVGFLWVTLIEGEAGEDKVIEQFYVPLTFFQAFKPVNLEVRGKNIEATTLSKRAVLYLSLCLEKKEVGFLDSVCTLVVNWADFDPIPYESKYCNFVASTNSSAPVYMIVDLKDEQSIARAFQKADSSEGTCFISTRTKIPPEPYTKFNMPLVSFFKIPRR